MAAAKKTAKKSEAELVSMPGRLVVSGSAFKAKISGLVAVASILPKAYTDGQTPLVRFQAVKGGSTLYLSFGALGLVAKQELECANALEADIDFVTVLPTLAALRPDALLSIYGAGTDWWLASGRMVAKVSVSTAEAMKNQTNTDQVCFPLFTLPGSVLVSTLQQIVFKSPDSSTQETGLPILIHGREGDNHFTVAARDSAFAVVKNMAVDDEVTEDVNVVVPNKGMAVIATLAKTWGGDVSLEFDADQTICRAIMGKDMYQFPIPVPLSSFDILAWRDKNINNPEKLVGHVDFEFAEFLSALDDCMAVGRAGQENSNIQLEFGVDQINQLVVRYCTNMVNAHQSLEFVQHKELVEPEVVTDGSRLLAFMKNAKTLAGRADVKFIRETPTSGIRMVLNIHELQFILPLR